MGLHWWPIHSPIFDSRDGQPHHSDHAKFIPWLTTLSHSPPINGKSERSTHMVWHSFHALTSQKKYNELIKSTNILWSMPHNCAPVTLPTPSIFMPVFQPPFIRSSSPLNINHPRFDPYSIILKRIQNTSLSTSTISTIQSWQDGCGDIKVWGGWEGLGRHGGFHHLPYMGGNCGKIFMGSKTCMACCRVWYLIQWGKKMWRNGPTKGWKSCSWNFLIPWKNPLNTSN